VSETQAITAAASGTITLGGDLTVKSTRLRSHAPLRAQASGALANKQRLLQHEASNWNLTLTLSTPLIPTDLVSRKS